MKHQHRWQFMKREGAHYSPRYSDDGLEVPGRWHEPKILFVCECGKIREVIEIRHSSKRPTRAA